VKSIFEVLTEDDLYKILKNLNNPIVLGKKLDFAAYGIEVKFEDEALREMAERAFSENTGARGLVSAIEQALLLFENKLPSTTVKRFPVTRKVVEDQAAALERLLNPADQEYWQEAFERIAIEEKESVKAYITTNRQSLENKYNQTLSPQRIGIVADYYCRHVTDIGNALRKVKKYYDEVKKIELSFYNRQDINIVLEDDAIDYIIEQVINTAADIEQFSTQISRDFEHGLKLVREKTGRTRYFITKEALMAPEVYIGNLLRDKLAVPKQTSPGTQ